MVETMGLNFTPPTGQELPLNNERKLRPSMDEPQVPLIKIVRDGLERVCKEFTEYLSQHGFVRSKKMLWIRSNGESLECISFFRRGSTYGSAHTASVDIRVAFFTEKVGHPSESGRRNGPWSDKLRDAKGYAYHLRFNASSWSTYDRCLDD